MTFFYYDFDTGDFEGDDLQFRIDFVLMGNKKGAALLQNALL
jgi:hypothetical protein